MINEVTLSNRGKNSLDILIEPTADLIDFHPMTKVTLRFEGIMSNIDLSFLTEEGVVQIFSNPKIEFLEYVTEKIAD